MRIVLGISGGIAAYKAVEVCRRLVDAGHHVTPVMTDAARRFVGAATLSALASEPVPDDLWSGGIPHTRLGQQADLVVVAPATADLIARYAAGIADDLLTATLLATRAPVVVCPAMHTEMWEHPAVADNLAVLRRRGVQVIGPESGRLAGGDVGTGRMAEPETIVAGVLGLGDLAGRHVVVSAGGTREAIDPVRVITNRSSGHQGVAIAEVASRWGAEVTLVSASRRPLALDVARRVAVVPVDTADEMAREVLARAAAADVVVMAAAVADFTVEPSAHKLKKQDGTPDLVLKPTLDILAELGRRRRDGQVLVGFAAETDEVLARGADKLRAKGCDLLVVNDVSAPGAGFDVATNEVDILRADGTSRHVSVRSKEEVASEILSNVTALLRGGL